MIASPEEVVRQCLVNAGLVILPGVIGKTVPYQQIPYDGTTVCYVSSMPDQPDQAVCVYGMVGLNLGRVMRGRTIVHPGVKIVIRALDFPTGFPLANAITQALDQIQTAVVTVSSIMSELSPTGAQVLGSVACYVQSVYRTSTLVNHGEETNKRRQLWSVNARVAFQDQNTPVG